MTTHESDRDPVNPSSAANTVTDDELLDWSLGHLDSPRREQVEQELAGSPHLRERADAVHRTLAILDKFKVEEPAGDLAERICRDVAARRAEPEATRTVRPSIFSFAEVLATAAALLLLALVFVPGVMKAHSMKLRVACESNMQHVGVALESFADGHQQTLPFAKVDAARGDGNWLNRDHGRHVSGTAPLFVLLQEGTLRPADLNCPAGDDPQFAGACEGLRDFPDTVYCSYSFQNFFDRSEPMVRDKAKPVPIMADRNPLFRNGTYCADSSGTSNSFNHSREGQNVLYTDGRVVWTESPMVEGDNIWIAGEQRGEYRGMETSTSATDWFFAP